VTPPVVWLPEADADLKDALAWYEDIRPHLALRFALAVEETVGAIARNPLQFAEVHKGRWRTYPAGMKTSMSRSRCGSSIYQMGRESLYKRRAGDCTVNCVVNAKNTGESIWDE
jgi:plasmid stabilization system protein ParE